MIAQALYPFLIALGAVVSYEDWRERKVRNRWIAAGLAAAAGAWLYLLLNSALGHLGARAGALGEFYMPWSYFPRLAAHAALSLAAALLLWRWGVWPAGDAKLFWTLSLLLPLIDPNLPGFPRLLTLVLLINVFVPAGLALAAEVVARAALRAALGAADALRAARAAASDWRRHGLALADRARVRFADHWPWRWHLLALAVNLFTLFTAFRLLQRWLVGAASGPGGRLLVFAALCSGWGKVARALRDRSLGAAALCAVSACSAAGAWRGADVGAWLWRGLTMLANFGMFLYVAQEALRALAQRQSLARLDAGEVQPGLILCETTWERLRREPALRGALGKRYSDGLSAEEAGAVRAWLASGGRVEGARLYRAVPFAAWVFAGCLLTFRFKTSALHALLPGARAAWDAMTRSPWWCL